MMSIPPQVFEQGLFLFSSPADHIREAVPLLQRWRGPLPVPLPLQGGGALPASRGQRFEEGRGARGQQPRLPVRVEASKNVIKLATFRVFNYPLPKLATLCWKKVFLYGVPKQENKIVQDFHLRLVIKVCT